MFNLENFFHKKPTFEDYSTLLKTNPEVMEHFENVYKESVLNQEIPEDFFAINSKQASCAAHSENTPFSSEENDIIDRIVNEFLSETSAYRYTRANKEQTISQASGLPNKEDCVSITDLQTFEKERRPQCTSHLQKRDIKEESYPMLLQNLQYSMDEKRPEQQRRQFYHMFRQGLDILDIDPITYEIIGTNPVSMGYWLPKITTAVDNQGFFKIPSTTIIKVPMNILQLTRCDYFSLSKSTLAIVDRFCYKAFDLKNDGDYFIKTGTYSSKFDFRNCRVTTEKEINELGEYLLFIHTQACQMASPLNIDKNGKPVSIYGVSTTNEWVVRECIKDEDNTPTIYKGLPLHTEYRVFVDFDNDTVLDIFPYWHPETMKKRFGDGADENVHDRHDYIVYKAHEETLMNRYNQNKDLVMEKIKEVIPNIPLTGQWSIDIMQNGDTFWLIDMALAETSAFYDLVPNELKIKSKENWIPQLSINKQYFT